MRGLGAGGGGPIGEVGGGGGMLERDGQIGLDLKVMYHPTRCVYVSPLVFRAVFSCLYVCMLNSFVQTLPPWKKADLKVGCVEERKSRKSLKIRRVSSEKHIIRHRAKDA